MNHGGWLREVGEAYGRRASAILLPKVRRADHRPCADIVPFSAVDLLFSAVEVS
jgi:hypothetical protein